MATIAGIECSDGALLVADRRRVDGGRLRTDDADHLVDLGAVGAAAVGGDPDRFARELRVAVERYRTDRGRGEPGIVALATLADEALGPGAAALVAARDDEGRPRVRAVDADGSLPADPVAARGSGADLVLGALGTDASTLDAATERAEAAFAAAAERDPGTGTELDRYRLVA